MISLIELLGCRPKLNIAKGPTDTGTEYTYRPANATFSSYQAILIPDNITSGYSRKQVKPLIEFLSKACPDKEIMLTIDSNVNFVDSGENFEKIICPNCGKQIEWDLWQSWMEEKKRINFSFLSIYTACCRVSSELNELKYVTDCGFSKTKITIFDPDTIDKPSLLAGIKRICNFDSVLIQRHY